MTETYDSVVAACSLNTDGEVKDTITCTISPSEEGHVTPVEGKVPKNDDLNKEKEQDYSSATPLPSCGQQLVRK